MSGQPSRYQRSFAGLVGALIMTAVALGVFLAWRAMFSGDGSVEVETVDWRESVELARSADMAVVHPTRLPSRWRATSVDLVATGETRWGMGMLTGDEEFVGLRQQDTSPSTLLETYLDEDAEQDGEVDLGSEVAPVWQVWTDEGGDTGLLAEVGDDLVLVYGSAPRAQLEEFAELLTR